MIINQENHLCQDILEYFQLDEANIFMIMRIYTIKAELHKFAQPNLYKLFHPRVEIGFSHCLKL